MKNDVYEITDNIGEVWELVPTVRAGEKFITVSYEDSVDFYRLKPTKTEKKEKVHLQIWNEGVIGDDYNNILNLTPHTALKLSEAISALVEYVQGSDEKGFIQDERYSYYFKKAYEARKSYQGEPE